MTAKILKMPETKRSYIVKWGCEVEEATSPKDAAEKMHAVLRAPIPWLAIFYVTDQATGETVTVDLSERVRA